MDANQIMIIAIIILFGIIFVFGIYFAIVNIYNKRHEKKMDTIFNTDNLIEEESLMNILDDKKNIDFKEEKKEDKRTFIQDTPDVEIVTSKVMENEGPINPFSVDLTKKTRDSKDNTSVPENSGNRFFK